MPKGMTPKNRMLKTTASLARALKPTGRLNVDDMKRASDARKKMSFSEIKKRKELAKEIKNKPKTKRPSSRPTSQRSTPMTKALGPLRPLRERSQSKLVSRRRGTNKR